VLTLSKKVEYGLISLLHMAVQPRGTTLPAKDIAEAFDIPAELENKVLQGLARAGLVQSHPGAHGGYRLRRAIDTVTLGEVIEALEGPVHLARCQEDPANCGQFTHCNIKAPILQIHEQLVRFIHGLSLASFRAPAAPALGAAGPRWEIP
jgi:Rrf2 family transcriptional regulator, cysteine metabolism repressor